MLISTFQIGYSSNLAEILAFSANFPEDLSATVKAIPRLAGTGRPSYQDDVSKDWTCIRLREQNNIGEKREAKEGTDKVEKSGWIIHFFFYRSESAGCSNVFEKALSEAQKKF